jgi:methylmalonyl-CoA mutase N-terminal domain/subunit
LKRERDGLAVYAALSVLKDHAKDESVNLMPDICECVRNDATLQEICDVLREIFGEFQQTKL